jgi:hypothetical protein
MFEPITDCPSKRQGNVNEYKKVYQKAGER